MLKKGINFILSKCTKRVRDDDQLCLCLYGLEIKLSRKSNLNVPHEISIIVPRAEIRETIIDNEGKPVQREIILNSITVVHAPRSPISGEKQQPPLIPQKTDTNHKTK